MVVAVLEDPDIVACLGAEFALQRLPERGDATFAALIVLVIDVRVAEEGDRRAMLHRHPRPTR
jgi:hypothetical protein